MEKNLSTDPREFYRALTKKEKGIFLLYLSREYGLKAATMSAKLRNSPKSELYDSDKILLNRIINEGNWRILE